MIEFTGTYVGDPDQGFSDESNNRLTDESDNPLTLERSAEMQVERLTHLRGRWMAIERERLSDKARHYLTARLLAVDFQTRVTDGTRIATVSPRFETAQDAWRSATRRTVTGSLDMSAHQRVVKGKNAGLLPARQAIVSLTFSRRGTRFDLFGADGRQAWHWRLKFDSSDPAAGTWVLTAGASLEVSTVDIANAYSRWSPGPGHTVQPLIWLAPGEFWIEAIEEVDATNTGAGTVDVEVQFFEEYP
ncbi:MAG: hypothetical protein OXP73_02080 [Chloroflexota bacterium]|nr:hypothetical protein [Chloroflexota bacterium]